MTEGGGGCCIALVQTLAGADAAASGRADARSARAPRAARRRPGPASLLLLSLAGGCHLVTNAGDYEVDGAAFGPAGAGGGAAAGAGGGGGGVPEGCVEVEPAAATLDGVRADLDAVSLGAPLRTALGGAPADVLTIVMKNGAEGDTLLGTFDLGADADRDTCVRCVQVLEDFAAPERFARVYFQAAGSMKVEFSPLSFTARVEISGLKLVETDVLGFAVPGGRCLFVRSYAWDVSGCQQAAQCGDPGRVVCEPDQSVCAAYECTLDGAERCGAGEICLGQVAGPPAVGACYRTCALADAGACAEGESCQPSTLSSTGGICLLAGTSGPGDICAPSPVSSDCEPGYICLSDGLATGSCAQICDYFGAATDPCLNAGDLCDPNSICAPQASVSVSDAGAGEACGTNEANAYCALDPAAERVRGLCVDEAGAAPLCRPFCRLSVAADCPEGSACGALPATALENRFVGVCRPSAAAGAP